MADDKSNNGNKDLDIQIETELCNSGVGTDTLNTFLNADIVDANEIYMSDESASIYESKEFLEKERDSYIQVDAEFGRFLTNFVDIQNQKEEQKLHLKEQFFWLVMIGFLALMLTPLILFVSVDKMSDVSLAIAAISTLIEGVSAIIVLPKIIAKYLFNKEEDKHMLEIISGMQEYNEQKHTHIDNNNKQ